MIIKTNSTKSSKELKVLTMPPNYSLVLRSSTKVMSTISHYWSTAPHIYHSTLWSPLPVSCRDRGRGLKHTDVALGVAAGTLGRFPALCLLAILFSRSYFGARKCCSSGNRVVRMSVTTAEAVECRLLSICSLT